MLRWQSMWGTEEAAEVGEGHGLLRWQGWCKPCVAQLELKYPRDEPGSV